MRKKFSFCIVGIIAFILTMSTNTVDAHSEVIHSNGWIGYTGEDAATMDYNSPVMQDFLNSFDGPVILNGTQYNGGSAAPAETPAVPQTETPQPAPTPAPKKECSHEYTTEITKEATCKEEGELKMTCKHCGEVKTEAIPKSDEHDYILVEAEHEDATCNKEGKDVYECSVCGEKYEEVIPKTEHEYEISGTVAASCTENGTVTYSCKVCGDSYAEGIEAEGHDEGIWKTVKERGIFTDGLEEKECGKCGETLEEKIIPSKYPYFCKYIFYGGLSFAVVLIATLVAIKKVKAH